MSHIQMERVAVSCCQTRKRVKHGLYATLTPMRFQDGNLYTVRHGQRYTCQRLFGESGQEFLYILSFYLPRFLQTSLSEKLVTVFHELWHIGPEFDGDIRRHEGRYHMHSHSQTQYDQQMKIMVDAWLACSPPVYLYTFLDLDFDQLCQRYGRIVGTKIPHPKLIPVNST